MKKLFHRMYSFYRDGFLSMTLGRTLWKIIFIKLFIMFAVMKLFFFPNYLKSNFETDAERSQYVLEQLSREPLMPLAMVGAATKTYQEQRRQTKTSGEKQ